MHTKSHIKKIAAARLSIYQKTKLPTIRPQMLTAGIFGAFLGFCYVVWLLPTDFLLGQSGLWSIGDPGAYVSALHAYLNDSWHYPPLKTTSLNYPEGVNAAFADILPILALPIKLLRSWIPQDVNYFGYWIVLAYTMQGMFAACLMYLMGCQRWTWLLLTTTIFIMSPAMLFRVHAHIALTSHAYILLALLIYFLMTRGSIKFWNSVIAYISLTSVALLTHPYLFAMVYPIYLASIIDCLRLGLCWEKALAAIALSAIIILGLLWFGGYISHGATSLSGGGGFGSGSMNLVAPIMGGSILDPSAWRDHTGMYDEWPMPYNATGGQYEGYNHLGIGVLAALLGVLVFRAKWILDRSLNHPALLVMMLCFTFYAISSQAYFAGQLLWSFSLPNKAEVLAEQFRASGRFFWPVGYLLTLVALTGVTRIRLKTSITALLAAILLVQFIDTRPLRGMTRWAATLSAPTLMTDDWWQQRIDNKTALYLFPTFGCGARTFEDVLPAQRLATTHDIPFNTGTLARGYGTCEEKESALNQGLQSNNMYIFLTEHYDKETLNARFGADTISTHCVLREIGYVCTP
ncbi:hypothetical protein ThidrDRAFT_3465 [Thiorhodococcus drewsii AZ1]|uniref:Glycosyltransferase RgtA/B/C/D-like domain-containing protein n=1 Tax=Thiorhodococcus drewsii AZ1 TaxID=765913 RepID=G2E5A2_9GAMM|nr:DUF6311 domain-containing protein [Thiorhodococcus drewsii]EGV28814.1 hypothetical protein ThidrDRAFT_3465 [Thiorhodococcus drewsii AZ1]